MYNIYMYNISDTYKQYIYVYIYVIIIYTDYRYNTYIDTYILVWNHSPIR